MPHLPEVFFKNLLEGLGFRAANGNVIDVDGLLTHVVQSSGGGS